MPLNERDLRKPGFTEGSPVSLADGQPWWFPKVRVRFRPKLVDGKIEVDGGASFGPEFDASLDILFRVTEVEPIETLRVEFETAVRLLQSNYDVTVEQAASLLEMEPGDPASDERWDQLRSVVRALPPKPTADTSDSPA